MANLTVAPVVQVDKAKKAYKAFKAYAKKHGINYARVYNSYNTKSKVVRTKVYAVSGVTKHEPALAKMGFMIIHNKFGFGYASLIGNF